MNAGSLTDVVPIVVNPNALKKSGIRILFLKSAQHVARHHDGGDALF